MIWHHIFLYGKWQEIEVYGLAPLQNTVDVASLFELALYCSYV